MNKLSRFQAIALAFVIAIALAVTAAVAQTTDGGAKGGRHGGFGHQGRHGDFAMMGFSQLDLTDAQKAQLKQIRENHRQSMAPVMQELRAKRQELRAGNQAGAFDEAAATAKLREIAPLEAKLLGERARLHQEMMGVLTAEQKAKLDQLKEQFKSRRAERRANRQEKSN